MSELNKRMKITIIGPAYPYRGGIAQFNEMLGRSYQEQGAEVNIITFTLQYPQLLFPGKSQYSESSPPEGLQIERMVNSINPFNWRKVVREVRKTEPDLVIMKFWTPFLAPCLGSIARGIRRGGSTKVVVSVDNITPHEPRFTDRALNNYFIQSVDGFVYMSQQVGDDLASFKHNKPSLFSPHPIYTGYGEVVSKQQACAELGLDAEMNYSLFFGLIRDYKGLDLLLDAWQLLKEREGFEKHRLIVAGEFYTNRDKYLKQIEDNGLVEDILLHDFFVPDERVKYYFSAADLLVQPYWTATQSGVTQIAYNFELPMVVTNVGGLAEIVTDGVGGYVVEPTPESVARAIEQYYRDGNSGRMRANMAIEKARFSWENMTSKILECYQMTLL